MSNARIHTRNLAANWFGHGASMLVLFFLSPYIVHSLGKVEYGLWSLLTVLTGYMGLLDLGIRASTGRFIVLYLGRRDPRAVDETIRTSLGFYCGLGGVAMIAGVILGWCFPILFRSIPPDYHLIAQLLLPLLAVNVLLSALQGIFNSLLAAHERFDLARTIDLSVLALRTTATVLALALGYRITALALVSVSSQALAVIGYYGVAKNLYPPLRIWPVILNTKRLRELFGYGLGAFVSAISVNIMGQTDLVLAGAMVGISAAAVYTVGAMLVFYVNTFLAHIGTTLFPALQRAVAREEPGNTRWIFLRTSRLRLICGLLVFVGMIVFAEPFIRLWMYGPQFDDTSVLQAALVMQLLAGSKLLSLFNGASVSLLNAMGRVRLTASMVAVEAAVNLTFSLIFVLGFHWGLAGIAGGTLAARILVGTFIIPRYACAALDYPWTTYLARIGGTGLMTGAVFALVCLVIRTTLPGGSWFWFMIQVGLATTSYGLLAFWFMVYPAERQQLWTKLLYQSA